MPVFTVPQGPPDGPAGPDGPGSSLSDYGGIYWQGSATVAPGPPQPLLGSFDNPLTNADGNLPSTAGVTPNFALSRLTINTAGIYSVYFSISFRYPPLGLIVMSAGVNGVLRPEVRCNQITFSGLPAVCADQGLISLAPGDVLVVYARPAGATINSINVDCGQLYVERADP